MTFSAIGQFRIVYAQKHVFQGVPHLIVQPPSLAYVPKARGILVLNCLINSLIAPKPNAKLNDNALMCSFAKSNYIFVLLISLVRLPHEMILTMNVSQIMVYLLV